MALIIGGRKRRCTIHLICICSTTSSSFKDTGYRTTRRWLGNGFSVHAQRCSFLDVMAHRYQRLRPWPVMLSRVKGLERLKMKGAEQPPLSTLSSPGYTFILTLQKLCASTSAVCGVVAEQGLHWTASCRLNTHQLHFFSAGKLGGWTLRR